MPAKCLYKCPLMGLLAFFTVVASSQISPHTAFVLALTLCKGNGFLSIGSYVGHVFSLKQCFLTFLVAVESGL